MKLRNKTYEFLSKNYLFKKKSNDFVFKEKYFYMNGNFKKIKEMTLKVSSRKLG